MTVISRTELTAIGNIGQRSENPVRSPPIWYSRRQVVDAELSAILAVGFAPHEIEMQTAIAPADLAAARRSADCARILAVLWNRRRAQSHDRLFGKCASLPIDLAAGRLPGSIATKEDPSFCPLCG